MTSEINLVWIPHHEFSWLRNPSFTKTIRTRNMFFVKICDMFIYIHIMVNKFAFLAYTYLCIYIYISYEYRCIHLESVNFICSQAHTSTGKSKPVFPNNVTLSQGWMHGRICLPPASAQFMSPLVEETLLCFFLKLVPMWDLCFFL